MNINCSCDTCSHKGICKYEDDLRDFKQDIEIPADEALSDIFDVSIRCKKYSNSTPFNIKDIDPNNVPIRDNMTYDPCKYCPTYKILMSGETFTGDLPCLWCTHGSQRITNHQGKSIDCHNTEGPVTGIRDVMTSVNCNSNCKKRRPK